ncbi:hypothetical protein P74p3 [Thermus phage P74-26]|uniref:Uncharacterized protein n=1 Tax=Thermus phage P74-26 TaxID=2914007 RepID=A7XXG2_BP742|nr:hypothetical protein P74p3 [Thermus phage P74-26]ABU96953.1 hypothetical protein P74p3 [Thermus phage P74-26]
MTAQSRDHLEVVLDLLAGVGILHEDYDIGELYAELYQAVGTWSYTRANEDWEEVSRVLAKLPQPDQEVLKALFQFLT